MNTKQQAALCKRIVALSVAYPKIVPADVEPMTYFATMCKETRAFAKDALSQDPRWQVIIDASKKDLEAILLTSACVVGAIRVARKHVLAQA